MLDDFGGQNNDWEMDGWLELLRRTFPGREMFKLGDDHPLLRLHYQIDNLQMEHPMSFAKSTFYGFNDSHGRLAMVICWANDIGDYWEFIDQLEYKVKPSAEALKIGINIAIYSMTHYSPARWCLAFKNPFNSLPETILSGTELSPSLRCFASLSRAVTLYLRSCLNPTIPPSGSSPKGTARRGSF